MRGAAGDRRPYRDSHSRTATRSRLSRILQAIIAPRLHQRGVTHVVVHRRDLGPERSSESAKIASLQWQDDDGDVYLYKLR